MSRKGRKLLSAVLLVVFLCSSGIVVSRFLASGAARDSYADAAMLARPIPDSASATTAAQPLPEENLTLPARESRKVWVPVPVKEDPVMELLAATDLSALREQNPDVVGWIHIPDTRIDYPILQGPDNDYYLNRNWLGQYQVVGSVFLEYRSDPGLTDYNTVVYAHNMADGTMFHDLHKLNYPAYRGNIPYVYIVTDAGVLRYQVFSTYDAEVGGQAYSLDIRNHDEREAFLTHALENSLFGLGVEPAVTDQILTLSTCSAIGYGHRRVVHARLAMMEVTLE